MTMLVSYFEHISRTNNYLFLILKKLPMSSSDSETESISYMDFTKEQLILEIKKKQRIIAELVHQDNKDNGEAGVYRRKLEEQIEQNQKAIKNFEDINIAINSLLQKVGSTKKSINGKGELLGNFSKSKNSKNLPEVFECLEEEMFSSISDEYCLDQITKQTLKGLSKLEFQINLMVTQTSLQNSFKPLISEISEQSEMKKEIKDLKSENKILKELIKNLEKDYSAVIRDITSCRSRNNQVELEHMDKQGLINLNRSLYYSLEELQKEKKVLLEEKSAQKQNERVKYMQLLEMIKKEKKVKIMHR